jgi:hypothetical protein
MHKPLWLNTLDTLPSCGLSSVRVSLAHACAVTMPVICIHVYSNSSTCCRNGMAYGLGGRAALRAPDCEKQAMMPAKRLVLLFVRSSRAEQATLGMQPGIRYARRRQLVDPPSQNRGRIAASMLVNGWTTETHSIDPEHLPMRYPSSPIVGLPSKPSRFRPSAGVRGR